MIRSLRRSFAAKLIVGGCVLALIVVGGVASYLIYSRAQQTRAAAQSNADNRVGVMTEVLNRFTGVQSLSAAAGLASQPALRAALTSTTPELVGAGDLRRHHAGRPRRRGAADHRRRRQRRVQPQFADARQRAGDHGGAGRCAHSAEPRAVRSRRPGRCRGWMRDRDRQRADARVRGGAPGGQRRPRGRRGGVRGAARLPVDALPGPVQLPDGVHLRGHPGS